MHTTEAKQISKMYMAKLTSNWLRCGYRIPKQVINTNNTNKKLKRKNEVKVRTTS